MINKLLINFQNNKNDITLFLEIVKYYRFSNNFVEAEKFINENEQFKDDDRVKFELANIFFSMDKKDEAIKNYIYKKLFFKDLFPMVNLQLIRLNNSKKIYKMQNQIN
jgi:hypothetical protein